MWSRRECGFLAREIRCRFTDCACDGFSSADGDWVLCRAMGWKEWPDDVLRHSYGSYHLAKHKNATLTAEQMGDKNARMLYAHYREVVKNADHIGAYWSLTPAAVSGNIIPLDAAA